MLLPAAAGADVRPPETGPGSVAPQIGAASVYHPRNHGRRTASGQRYDRGALTAAHRALPLHSKARVTNLANGRSVVVTVNDRGPGDKRRVIDLSREAARTIGMNERGLARVKVEPLGESGGGKG